VLPRRSALFLDGGLACYSLDLFLGPNLPAVFSFREDQGHARLPFDMSPFLARNTLFFSSPRCFFFFPFLLSLRGLFHPLLSVFEADGVIGVWIFELAFAAVRHFRSDISL